MKTLSTTTLAFALALGFTTGCTTESHDHSDHTGHDHGDKDAKPHWEYTGETGPAHWGGLSPEFIACAEGLEQSPIDLTSATASDLTDIAFSYQPSSLRVVNNGHTIQANYDAGSSIVSGGKTYNLLQFHLHAPSEHTLDGESFPVELHLVHQAEDGALAVVGLMIREGAANAALADVFANMPAEADGKTEKADVQINAEGLLPADRRYFAYPGSLTTPPCSEGVAWHVIAQPIEASAEQIAAFTALHPGSNRPVQPLNTRELKLDSQ